MQIDDHIRYCPAIRRANGLEPYPQPSVIFSATPTGTVQVRIYDFSVQPPVQLTSSALSGAELTSPTLTGLTNNYTLDMGHANVTAVIDAETSEGLECVVLFEDSGGTGEQRFIKVSCNDEDHVSELYPERAIYADANSSNTGTTFPAGSTVLPCRNLSDAVSIFSSRGATILDCAGSWDLNHWTAGGASGSSGGVLQADIGSTLASTGSTLIRTRATANWFPHNSGDLINLVDCKVQSVNVPYGFAVANFGNGTLFAGAPRFISCRVPGDIYITGDGISRYGQPDFTDSKIDGAVYMSGSSTPGCFASSYERCVWPTTRTIDMSSSNSGSTMSWVGCTGGFTIANLAAGRVLSIRSMEGIDDITLAASSSNSTTVTITGNYNSFINSTGGTLTSLTERKGAAQVDVAAVEADTQDIQSRLPATLVGGRMDSDVGNMQAGTVTAAAVATDALDADALASDAVAEIQVGLSTLDAAGVRTAIGLANADLDTQLAALPTDADVQAAAETAIGAQEPIAANVTQVNTVAVSGVADFRATGYATPANITASQGVITTRLDGMSGATFNSATDSLEEIRNNLGGAGLTAQNVRDAMQLAPTSGTEVVGSIDARLTGIEGTAFDTATDSLEQIRNNLSGGGSTIGPRLILKAPALERPTASVTETYTVIVETRNSGQLTDPDSNTINVTVANQAGTDRSSGLGAATMTRLRTGQYSVTYDVAGTDAVEQLVFTFVCAFSTTSYTFTETASVLDTSGTEPVYVLSGV